MGDEEEQTGSDCEADDDQCKPVRGIFDPAGQGHGTCKPGGALKIKRERTEQPARSLRQDEDQCKGGKYLVEVVAVVKPADDHGLDDDSGSSSSSQRCCKPQQEGTRPARYGGSRKGADHEQRTMGQVDQSHDAEDQCQA